MSKVLPNVFQKFYLANGQPNANGKLYSFAAGTNTPLATYTDKSGGTPNANPTILSSVGVGSIWIPQTTGYKFQLQDSLGNIIWTVDEIFLIEPKSVESLQIAVGAVTNVKLAANPISTAKICLAAITSELIAAGNVTTGTIADDTVEIVDLDPSIDLTELNNVVPGYLLRSYDLSGDRMFATPTYPWSPPTKLSNPGVLPTGAPNCCRWSPDGRFLAVGHATSPRLTIYERTGSVLTKLANPATLPAGTVNDISWSGNGDFLVCTHVTTPFFTIYRRQGINFTKLSDPAALPSSTGFGVAFSPNGEILIVTSNLTDVQAYSVKGTTFTDITNASGISTSGGGGINTRAAWTRDSQYLALSSQHTNVIAIMRRDGSVFSNLTSPPVQASGTRGLAWSPDSQFLACALNAAPYIAIFQFAAGQWTQLATPFIAPSGSAAELDWSPDGQYLAVAFTGSPFILIYSVSGTTFSTLGNPASLPADDALGISWAGSLQYLSVAVASTPFINTYQTSGTFVPKGVLYGRTFVDV